MRERVFVLFCFNNKQCVLLNTLAVPTVLLPQPLWIRHSWSVQETKNTEMPRSKSKNPPASLLQGGDPAGEESSLSSPGQPDSKAR